MWIVLLNLSLCDLLKRVHIHLRVMSESYQFAIFFYQILILLIHNIPKPTKIRNPNPSHTGQEPPLWPSIFHCMLLSYSFAVAKPRQRHLHLNPCFQENPHQPPALLLIMQLRHCSTDMESRHPTLIRTNFCIQTWLVLNMEYFEVRSEPNPRRTIRLDPSLIQIKPDSKLVRTRPEQNSI